MQRNPKFKIGDEVLINKDCKFLLEISYNCGDFSNISYKKFDCILFIITSIIIEEYEILYIITPLNTEINDFRASIGRWSEEALCTRSEYLKNHRFRNRIDEK